MYKTAYFKGVFHLERNDSIEKRAVNLAHYIIDSRDTVRGAAKKFGVSKSTVHTDVTLKNGMRNGQVIPDSIEIKGVFLAEKIKDMNYSSLEICI